MTAGVFASIDAPRIGLLEGIARIFETLERMSEHDQEAFVEMILYPEDNEITDRLKRSQYDRPLTLVQ